MSQLLITGAAVALFGVLYLTRWLAAVILTLFIVFALAAFKGQFDNALALCQLHSSYETCWGVLNR